MQNNVYLNNSDREEEGEAINYKRIFFLFLKNWYWFAICTGIALAGAFFYNRYYKQQVYSIDTSILISGESNNMDMGNLFEKALMKRAMALTIGNEIELLSSYTLSRRVFEKLNWRTSWYRRDLFKWNGLYPNEPFLVQEGEKAANPEGLDLYLEPGEDGAYTISASGEAVINNQPEKIKFKAMGKFGEPFENKYFHFTLYRKDPAIPVEEEDYRFRFNNINNLTKAYLNKEQIGENVKNNEVIRLSLQGTEPLREIHYLNGLVSEYIDQKLEFRTETQKRSLDFINRQISGISDSLNAAGSTVTQFRSQNQLLDISAEGSLVMQQLSEIEQEKSQSQMQLKYFENLLNYLGNTDSIKKMVMPSVIGIQDPSLNAVVLKLTDLYSRREILSFSTHENNPTLVLLNKEIGQVTRQLKENLVNLIDNARLNIRNQEQRQEVISRQLNKLPGKEQKLIDIRRQYELTSEIYTFMLQKRAEIDIALASTVSDVQVIDPARVERVEKSGKSPLINYILALVLGLGLPGVVFLILDYLDNTIRMQEDIEKLTSLTIMGNVPHSVGINELVVIEKPRAPITEAFRGIRTNLQYLLSQQGQQVIGIHSIQPGEGKTFSSINLACILAVNNKKVLLVGADMRKPRLHKVFNTSNTEGLSTWLIRKSDYPAVVQKTVVENLWLVPSGPIPPNPAELLECDQYGKLIGQAKQEFDFIIVDNAPVSFVTDGLITGSQADLNIFILRYGVSRKDQLKFINSIADQGLMKRPALLVNDIKLAHYGYGYHYSYRHKYYDEESEDRDKYKKILLGQIRSFINFKKK